MQLMAALGFLFEKEGDTKESAMARAEAALTKTIPSFSVQRHASNPDEYRVEPGKFKTAAFFYAKALEKGCENFDLTPEDISGFLNYMTTMVVTDAEENLGKHPTIDAVLSGTSLTIIVNLADVV
jgi:hypothetical protein